MAGNRSSSHSKSRASHRTDRAAPDDAARETAGIEWWFVQGRFQGPLSGVDHFMCTLIRNRIVGGPDRPGDGFALLLTVLDHDGSRSEFLSRVDRELVSWSMSLSGE
ncbi:MAG: hypothetical protein FJ122_18020, partial [Deltaproteobacteria bacterium]|nr:hypothetical protein [Deltaproteobacteria bacterium]